MTYTIKTKSRHSGAPERMTRARPRCALAYKGVCAGQRVCRVARGHGRIGAVSCGVTARDCGSAGGLAVTWEVTARGLTCGYARGCVPLVLRVAGGALVGASGSLAAADPLASGTLPERRSPARSGARVRPGPA